MRVGLELAGKRIAREGAAVEYGGKPVGVVTSGTFAPTLNKAIAMAYVDPAVAAIGSELSIDVRGKGESARVVPLPFYKRQIAPGLLGCESLDPPASRGLCEREVSSWTPRRSVTPRRTNGPTSTATSAPSA